MTVDLSLWEIQLALVSHKCGSYHFYCDFISLGLYSDYDLGRIFQILMNVKFLGVVRKFVSIGKEGSNVIVSMVIKRTHMILLDAGKNGIHYSWYAVYEIVRIS